MSFPVSGKLRKNNGENQTSEDMKMTKTVASNLDCKKFYITSTIKL